MANPLSHLEDLAARLVEGTFARMLGARLQPIEVARHIARAMEDGQVIGPRGQVVVPNAYLVHLHPDDLDALKSYQSVLQEELVRYVAGLAREVGATMTGRPRVFLKANPGVSLRRVRVEAQIHRPRRENSPEHTQALPSLQRQTQTEDAPTFVLFDGYRRMPITEAVVTIGRDLDNSVILDNKRVSRQHAQMRRRYGQYVLYDLDSTGGTTVNGEPVRESPLQAGDVIAFAGVKVRFEQADVVDKGEGSPPAGHTRPMPQRKDTESDA